ncbi:trehalose-6-phosphate hydrolase [Anabrus simplex]|uniref:trehalose-6-phosphate hydrolase n=1 Tax=Anabrus simplex TaxID=316456 RepID=UPI0035A291FD
MPLSNASEPWWRRSVVYQIYPKSFKDSDGDGIGDLKGIRSKLNYIKQLGVDAIWITPIYDSPMRDNGYDIRDYYKIFPPFGTMEDFDDLLKTAHDMELRIILDLVVNHTSTEHAWFQKSRLRKLNNHYRDYYIWRDGKNGEPPNNWESKFGGSAWAYDPNSGQYYLHLFDETQADLNWENEEVRSKVREIMRYWLDKGVDGFRMDVINLISKDQRFPDDDHGDGRRFYTDGPRVHEFLKELNEKVFSRYNTFTVGEMSSTSVPSCIKYSNPDNKELNMTFNFHHLKVDYAGGKKWVHAEVDFIALKRVLTFWQVGMHGGGGWSAVFWGNHDQPRPLSRYGDDTKYHLKSGKMLATVVHMLRGTPFIYQGEEIGMTNPCFKDINSFRDVETINVYRQLTARGILKEEALSIIRSKSRDNARTPMQWDESKYAGFGTEEPWIEVARNYKEINVRNALKDTESIFYHYQKLCSLRKTYDVIVHGDYRLLLSDNPEIFAFVRRYENEQLLVLNNFYGNDTIFNLPPESGMKADKGSIIISNYSDSPSNFMCVNLRPYESIVYLVNLSPEQMYTGSKILVEGSPYSFVKQHKYQGEM